MNEAQKSDVIYTPVYKGDEYLYHECSECKYQVRIQETLTPLYFGESFKYCPNCAGSVARFANLPKFIEEFNYAIFNKLDEIYNKYKDEVDYYCLVTLTQEEFEEMKSKCEFAVELSKNSGAYISPAVNMVAKMFRKRSHWDIKKLKERVEKGGAK